MKEHIEVGQEVRGFAQIDGVVLCIGVGCGRLYGGWEGKTNI